MYVLTNKPEMGARLCAALTHLAHDPARGTDIMKMIQYLGGVFVETYLVFSDPSEAMEGSIERLGRLLSCRPLAGGMDSASLPPAHIMDRETEFGRQAAREFFEDWLDCELSFHDMMITIAHNMIVSWESEGHGRAESFRLLVECIQRAMLFEIAAQELCDVVIEKKVAKEGWSLGDSIAALSAIAGRRLAQSLHSGTCDVFQGCNLPESLDRVVYVMTQEAVRLGVPAGSDWRFGLAANDVPINAPIALVDGIEPYCEGFFDTLGVQDLFYQAVSCAKAAGRMIAVASGGEIPEMEPAIAKPLAMSAMTETYKYVCMDHSVAVK